MLIADKMSAANDSSIAILTGGRAWLAGRIARIENFLAVLTTKGTNQ
jgi:hypothetical protein